MEKDIKAIIKKFIISEFHPDGDKANFDYDTPLMSSGIIDSISSLQLVSFIEKEFGFEFKPHEVDQDNLDTLNLIEEFVKTKL